MLQRSRPVPSTLGVNKKYSTLRYSHAEECAVDGTTYLTTTPQPSTPSQPVATGGSVTVESEIAGEIFIDRQATGRRIKAGGSETISNVSTGCTEVAVKDGNGATVKAPRQL
jgi:hypothetical protein